MMRLKIKPTDVLFFRDAKPFQSGEGVYGASFDVPFPSTIYGAIRTKLLFEHCQDYNRFLAGDTGKLTDVIGTPDKYGSLRIKTLGLWDEIRKIPRYPLPGDIVCEKDKEVLFPLQLWRVPPWLTTNFPTDYTLTSNRLGVVEKPEKKFIKENELYWYLNNDLREDVKEEEGEEIISREFRTGIKRSQKTGTVEEGYLYRTEVIRLSKDYSLYVELSGTEDLLPKKGLLKLGGESRGAFFQTIGEDFPSLELSDATKKKIQETGIFKVYLSTPALFKQGWLPSSFNQDREGELLDLRVKVLTAAINKYQMFSGWDMAKNRPRPGFRVVPAGSVYYCKVLDSDVPLQRIMGLHGRGISDERQEEGFGLIYIGGVDYV